jgi:hypothetical protein
MLRMRNERLEVRGKSMLNYHVILNGTKWSEESLKILPIQAVFGPDNFIFRPKIAGTFHFVQSDMN